MHCEDPGCLKACPAPWARSCNIPTASSTSITTNASRFGYCIKGCPFDIPRISAVDHKAYKCTLCSDRVAVGQGPACAGRVRTHAIVFGTKDEMKQHAAERINDLQSARLHERGPLRPPGVGGTHVMYVVQHADKPEIYAKLPKDYPADQSGRRILEGADEICRHGRDGHFCGNWRSALSGVWSQRGPAEG